MASPKQILLAEIIQQNPTMPKYKAMLKAGYKQSTANDRPELYEKAKLAVAEVKARNFIEAREAHRSHKSPEFKAGIPQPEASDLFTKIGMSREMIVNELVKVLKQDKDLNNKLKALTPFLQETGVTITGEQQQSAPVLNVSVTKTMTPLEAKEASYSIDAEGLAGLAGQGGDSEDQPKE